METKPLMILPCPHCGKNVTVMSNAKELEACRHFENEKCPYFEWEEQYCSCVCVVCDVSQGGCGATGGFATSEEKAIEKWNERYTQYDQEFWGAEE